MHVYTVISPYTMQQTLNLTLPKWVNATLMARLLNLTLYTDSLRFNSLTKKQLIAGRKCHISPTIIMFSVVLNFVVNSMLIQISTACIVHM